MTLPAQSSWVCQECRRPLVLLWWKPPVCPDHPLAAVVKP